MMGFVVLARTIADDRRHWRGFRCAVAEHMAVYKDDSTSIAVLCILVELGFDFV
jgi:hypothetical protein